MTLDRLLITMRATFVILVCASNICAQTSADDARNSDHCRQVSLSDLRNAPECQPRISQNMVKATVATLRVDRHDFRNPYSAGDVDNKCQAKDRTGGLHYSRICRCELKVQHAHFAGSQVGLERINEIEKEEAKSFRCSDEMASVARTVAAVSTSPNLVSVLIQQLLYDHSFGGGCQGNFKLTTYDAQTAHEFVLSEVVEATDFSRLLDLLAEDFMARYGSRAGDPGARERATREVQDLLANSDLKKTGIFVEARSAWINIDDFIFSCADGNLFPVQIPSPLLKSDFFKKLNP